MPNSESQFAAREDYEVGAVTLQEPWLVDVRPKDVPAIDTREFVRFAHLYRVLHACMIVSFLTLAITGLSLKFSYTPWAARFSRLLGGFETPRDISTALLPSSCSVPSPRT
jgi:hypothetical protein